jgi:hypothetical protein
MLSLLCFASLPLFPVSDADSGFLRLATAAEHKPANVKCCSQQQRQAGERIFRANLKAGI